MDDIIRSIPSLHAWYRAIFNTPALFVVQFTSRAHHIIRAYTTASSANLRAKLFPCAGKMASAWRCVVNWVRDIRNPRNPTGKMPVIVTLVLTIVARRWDGCVGRCDAGISPCVSDFAWDSCGRGWVRCVMLYPSDISLP